MVSIVSRLSSALGHVLDRFTLRGRDYISYSNHSNLIPLNPRAMDFFRSELKCAMPDTIYIVGTGPNGVPHFSRVPKGAFVIALNKAILIRELRPSLWMAFAPELPSKNWWYEALQTDTLRLFGRKLPLLYHCDYTFYADPSLHVTRSIYPAHQLFEGVLRGGATIAGCAIQAAYFARCRRVILVGVDMYGRTYFDGSESAESGKDSVWVERDNLNTLIRLVRASGMECFSLSETELDVETA
jgi:hypothetical protein